MPRYLISEPEGAFLSMLGDALDLVDFGIALFDRDLTARFINRRLIELWNIPPAFLSIAPTFRELLNQSAADGSHGVSAADLPAYLDARQAEIRTGSIHPVLFERADGRRILFRCVACADGGRILTCADITGELQQAAADAVERVSVEMRFNSEMLEDQAAHLASLAEAAEESAHRAEASRLLLEHEIAERCQLEVKLRRLATTDGLTGALSRTELLASAQREIEAGQTGDHKLVVLMIDVDHFKAINDCFGHAGGDSALRHLVTTLRVGTRQHDLLGRLGGEEFAIVLVDSPLLPAERAAERLRARVAGSPAVFGNRLIPMTISIGLAIQMDTDISIEPILARADDALYRAKSSGRNRVVKDLQPEPA
jgi:diguanylate cyclase (GGDEF)-like protein